MGSSPAWPASKISETPSPPGRGMLRRRFSRENKERKLADIKDSAIGRFYRETVGELRKVSWPTRAEAINLTTIVLVVLVGMALFLGLIDLIGETLLQLALGV